MASEVRLMIPAGVFPTPAQEIAELEISDLSEKFKALIKERLLHPSPENDKQINAQVDCLRKMAARVSLEQPILAQTTWQKIQKIAGWLQNNAWLTESQEALNQIAYYAALAKKTIELDLKLFGSLPEDLQTSSISGLIACCQISVNLKKQGNESFLGFVDKLIEKAQLLLPLKGKQVCLTPWIDAIFRQNAAFDRRTHEEEQLRCVTFPFLPLDQALAPLASFPAIKQALIQLAKREELSKALRQTNDAKDYPRRTFILQELGKAFAEESAAAHQKNSPYWQELLSYALMFYHTARKNIPQESQGTLINTIKQLEAFLQINIGAEQQAVSHWESDKKHLKALKQHRNEIHNKLAKILASQAQTDEEYLKRAAQLNQLHNDIVKRLKNFIEGLLLKSIHILGKPPCGYAMIGFGSLEKQSCTLYSDLEFGFLLEEGKDTESHRQYFRNLTHLLHAKVIALGETPIPFSLFNCSLDHLTGTGFGFDLGGKTSLGRLYEDRDIKYGEVKYELLGEPKQLLHYVEDEFFAVDKLLPIEVASCTHISGDGTITQHYQQLLQERFSKIDQKGRSFYQHRAMQLLKGNAFLKGDLEKYNPNRKLAMKGQLIDVKTDIYRLPDRLIDSLAFFFGIQAENTWEKIEILIKRGIIHAEFEFRLKIMDGITKELRLKTYQHYGEQKETLSLAPPLFKDNIAAFYEDQEALLLRFYTTGHELHNALVRFSETWDKNFEKASQLLISTPLQSEDLWIKAMVYERLDNSVQAHSCLKQLQKNNAQWNSAEMLFKLGNSCFSEKPFEARQYYEKALDLYKRQYGLQHPKVAETLFGIASTFGALGDEKQGHILIVHALKIFEKHYGEQHLEVANALVILASCYLGLYEAANAVNPLRRALAIQEKEDDQDSLRLANTLEHLGEALDAVGVPAEAKIHFERAHWIFMKHFGPEHFVTGRVLGGLGHSLINLGNAPQGKIYLEQALVIKERHLGKEHPFIANALVNLSAACNQLENPLQAKTHLERALKIFSHHYGEKHPKIAHTLCDLGQTYCQLQDFKQAKAYVKRALKIQENYYGVDHPALTSTLRILGTALTNTNNASSAETYLLRALDLQEKFYGKNFFGLADTLSDLGAAYIKLTNFNAARSCLERGLALKEKHYGNQHFGLATLLKKLGRACLRLDDEIQAKIHFERALAILEKYYGKDHLEVTQFKYE